MRKRSQVEEGKAGKVGWRAKSALALTATASVIGAADATHAHINKRQTATGKKIHQLLTRNAPRFADVIRDRNGQVRDDIFKIEGTARSITVVNGPDASGRKRTRPYRIQPGALLIDIVDTESLGVVREKAGQLSRCPDLLGRQVVLRFSVPVADLTQQEKGDLQKLGAVIGEYKGSKEAVIVGWIPTADKGTGPIGGMLALFLIQAGAILGRAYQRRKISEDERSDPLNLKELRGNLDRLASVTLRRQLSDVEYIMKVRDTLVGNWTREEGPPDEWRTDVRGFLSKVARPEDIRHLAEQYAQAHTDVSRVSVTRQDFERMIQIAENIAAVTTVLLAQDWAKPPAESDLEALRNLPDMQADLLFLKDHAPELRIDSMRIGDGAPIVFDPPLRPDAEGRLSFGIPVRQPREARSSWWPRPDKWLLRQIARFNRSRRNTDSPDS